jgi:protein-S-isoprenylcysteine O-methyltransferase Ste14
VSGLSFARVQAEETQDMTFLDWVAAIVLFVEMPVPLYWFVVHPQVGFWRRHVRAGYLTGLVTAWGIGGAFLARFRGVLFARETVPTWAIIAGVALIAFDPYIFMRAHRDLGTSRLVGEAEMKGSKELARTGIYAQIRHPRYLGMMAAILGACLLAATPVLWFVAAGWWLLAILAILLEEREMRRRFGAAFEEYSRRVPRFLPLRFGPREG